MSRQPKQRPSRYPDCSFNAKCEEHGGLVWECDVCKRDRIISILRFDLTKARKNERTIQTVTPVRYTICVTEDLAFLPDTAIMVHSFLAYDRDEANMKAMAWLFDHNYKKEGLLYELLQPTIERKIND